MLEFLTRLVWFPFEIMQGLSRRFLQIGRSIYGGLFPPAIKPPPPSSRSTTAASTCQREIMSSTSSKSTTKIRHSPSPSPPVIPSCVINMEPGQSPTVDSTSTDTQQQTSLSSTLSTSSSLKSSLVDLGLSSTITNTSNDSVSEITGSVTTDSVTMTHEAQAQVCDVKSAAAAAVRCGSGDYIDHHDDDASVFASESVNKNKRFREHEKRQEPQVNKRNVDSRCDSAKVDLQADEDLQSTQQPKKPRLSEETGSSCQGIQQGDNKLKKNKKRRSKKKKEVKQQSDPLGEAEDDKMPRRPPPPNHFIAIQISQKDIISRVAQFQQSLTEKELIPSWHDLKNTEIFRDAMVPVTKLHFTLHVMHLKDGEDDVEKAQAALAECCSQVHQEFVDNPMDLTIEGLGHFRNNVIFAQIKDKEHIDRLTRLSEIFRSKFNELNIPVDPRPFNPHMTIAKISRSNKLYKRKIRSFPPDFISNCGETNFGTQRVTGLQLLRMAGEDKATGYYNCLGQYFFEDPLLIKRHHQESESKNDDDEKRE